MGADLEIGFFAATVEVRIEQLANDRAAIEFVDDEGGRARLDTWTLKILVPPREASPPDDAERARRMRHVAAAPGQPFGSNLCRDRRCALLEDCAELGFPSAVLRSGANADPNTDLARVAWRLDPGPRTYIGSSHIEGLDRVEDKSVLRELLFKAGNRFSASRIDHCERRLVVTASADPSRSGSRRRTR